MQLIYQNQVNLELPLDIDNFSVLVSKDTPFDKYHDHPGRYSHTQDNGKNSSNDDPHRHLGRGIHLFLPC